jgi:hypothetical protein
MEILELTNTITKIKNSNTGPHNRLERKEREKMNSKRKIFAQHRETRLEETDQCISDLWKFI